MTVRSQGGLEKRESSYGFIFKIFVIGLLRTREFGIFTIYLIGWLTSWRDTEVFILEHF